MRDIGMFSRRDGLKALLFGATALGSELSLGARGASAQGAAIARADTLIATGQPSGGAPTFAQYNDFNPFHPGLDLRSSVAFVLEPLFFYSVLPDKMMPWLAESYEYNADYTAITVHLRKGVDVERRRSVHRRRCDLHARYPAAERPGQGRPALRLGDGARHQEPGARR